MFLPQSLALAANPRPKGDQVVLQLKWKHQFQFAGYYAAVEQGYYRNAGLEVKLVEGGPERRPIDEVLAGRADFGVANSEILLYRLQGKPVVALAVIFQHSPSVLLIKRDSGIRTPQDLVGRRVMLRPGVDSVEILAMFLNEGIQLDQIQRQALSYDIDDLIEGRTDAYHAYITDQSYYLQEKGVPFLIIHPMTYGIDFYGDTLFTTEEQIAQHPERERAFRKASLRGWQYAMDNPDEIIKVILDKYRPQKSKAHLQFEAESMHNLLLYEANAMRKLLYPDLIELGHMNPGRWKHIANTYEQLGMIKGGYSLDGFMYNPNALPDYAWIRWIIITLGILCLGAAITSGILFAFNSRLKKRVAQRTHELVDLNKELERHQERLEEEVATRTEDLRRSNEELQKALADVKMLTGLLPICASCKKIRDDKGYWNQLEIYIQAHSEAQFSHGLCPECASKLYPDFFHPKRQSPDDDE